METRDSIFWLLVLFHSGGMLVVCRLLGGLTERQDTPGKASGGQQLTVSLKQHSHTKYEKLATNSGAIGAPAWALWGGLGPTTGTVDPLPDSPARGQNMSDIHTTVTLHGNYSPQIPSSRVA